MKHKDSNLFEYWILCKIRENHFFFVISFWWTQCNNDDGALSIRREWKLWQHREWKITIVIIVMRMDDEVLWKKCIVKGQKNCNNKSFWRVLKHPHSKWSNSLLHKIKKRKHRKNSSSLSDNWQTLICYFHKCISDNRKI